MQLPSTKLYTESPILGAAVTLLPVVLYYNNAHIGWVILSIILLVFMLAFYRWYPLKIKTPIDTIICPADGIITEMFTKGNIQHISIFLSPANIHTQYYPVSGHVTSQTYDRTGKFDIVTDAAKSRDNEKVITHITFGTKNKQITVTQIAGFLPRMISYNPDNLSLPYKCQATDYIR